MRLNKLILMLKVGINKMIVMLMLRNNKMIVKLLLIKRNNNLLFLDKQLCFLNKIQNKRNKRWKQN